MISLLKMAFTSAAKEKIVTLVLPLVHTVHKNEIGIRRVFQEGVYVVVAIEPLGIKRALSGPGIQIFIKSLIGKKPQNDLF